MTDEGENANATAGSPGTLGEPVVIMLRPIGAPTSLGLYGLGASSWTLAGLQLGWIEPGEGKNVAFVLLGFTVVAQLLAAVFAFLGRDGTIGTAMAVLALTWLVVGLVLRSARPGTVSSALGLFLLFSGTTMVLVGVTASLNKLVVAAVFGLAALRFLVAGGYELSGSTFWERTSGVLGIALVLLALYAAFAAGLEDAMARTILPLGRHQAARLPEPTTPPQQSPTLATEPGVRAKL